MQKLLLLFVLIFCLSCEKNETDDLLPVVLVDESINLNLPQYSDLLTPTGWVYTTGGYKGIFIQNIGIGGTPYKAFERACPNNDCNTPMTFDGTTKFICPCDKSEYSVLDGSPQTAGNNYFAREYRVVVVSSSQLNITNY